MLKVYLSWYSWILIGLILTILAGCSAYTESRSFHLQTSNTDIDVVLHRSDVRFTDCGTLTVIQTYDSQAKLIDSKAARGRALHCEVLQAGIEAGGMVGAAATIRAASTKVNQAQGQAQTSNSVSTSTATATGGQGGSGGAGGQGGQGGAGGSGGGSGGDGGSGSNGNNGFGNGGGDGSPNGFPDGNR